MIVSMVAAALIAAGAVEVKVDWTAERGPVKPVNGVGQPPMNGGPVEFFMFHYLKEAGIPYSRLHDVGGMLGQGMWVDIPNVFPDFDADENDPKSYDFEFTDALLKGLSDKGVEPYYRLGVTIENFAYQGFSPRRIVPPKDFAKWARVCEHVIRHYTEGWANGLRLKITYWEIWNEPELKKSMWRDDFASYIRFYGVVAPYLKSKFPHLKIGGYGSAGAGKAQYKDPYSEPRKFLTAAKKGGWPLDFFSFHSYYAPTSALVQVCFADRMLNEYGFTRDRTERHFNEWLPYVDHANLGSAKQAAGVARELVGLQNAPCDLACIYDARCGLGNYSPLFNPMTLKPHKAYYAFTAFNELRKRGTAVAATSGDASVGVAAARGASGAAVMIANDSDEAKTLRFDFGGRKATSARITDANRTNEKLQGAPAALPPHSFCVVLFD